jgi:hypothetical protein
LPAAATNNANANKRREQKEHDKQKHLESQSVASKGANLVVNKINKGGK